jgi:predicted transcriptional regulator
MEKMKDLGEQISVRLPPDLLVKLEQIAAEEDRTLSGMVRRIVTRALESQSDRRAA